MFRKVNPESWEDIWWKVWQFEVEVEVKLFKFESLKVWEFECLEALRAPKEARLFQWNSESLTIVEHPRSEIILCKIWQHFENTWNIWQITICHHYRRYIGRFAVVDGVPSPISSSLSSSSSSISWSGLPNSGRPARGHRCHRELWGGDHDNMHPGFTGKLMVIISKMLWWWSRW